MITGLVEKCPWLNPGPPTIEPTSSEDHQPNGNAGGGKPNENNKPDDDSNKSEGEWIEFELKGIFQQVFQQVCG